MADDTKLQIPRVKLGKQGLEVKIPISICFFCLFVCVCVCVSFFNLIKLHLYVFISYLIENPSLNW